MRDLKTNLNLTEVITPDYIGYAVCTYSIWFCYGNWWHWYGNKFGNNSNRAICLYSLPYVDNTKNYYMLDETGCKYIYKCSLDDVNKIKIGLL